MKEKPDYKNWVSARILPACVIMTAVLAAVGFAAFARGGQAGALGVILLALFPLSLAFTLYMAAARAALSYEGGGVQGKVLDSVLSYLERLNFDGKGKIIDIGCGSGAMSIKAAKKYPDALVTGVDYWGANWDYSKALCEKNALLEGVADRVRFQQGDANRLDFGEVFDAAVSNFVFHEVRNEPDKHKLLVEALRVVKPGGAFVFQDIFFAVSHYGNIRDFVAGLSPYASEIHFADTRRPDYAPAFLNTPLILGQMGIIYGRK